MKNCENCERRNKHSEGCQVFTPKRKNCWAWTDDKGWLKKVNAAVKKYREAGGGENANKQKRI